jgi:hypothetical protein
MNQDDAKALLKECGGNRAEAARRAGLPRQTFIDRLNGRPESRKSPPRPAQGDGGRSLSDFRAAYDKAFIVPRKVKEALKRLGGGWEYEVNFAKMAQVSLSDLGMFRDEFAEHVVELHGGRRAWAGTAGMARQMRDML